MLHLSCLFTKSDYANRSMIINIYYGKMLLEFIKLENHRILLPKICGNIMNQYIVSYLYITYLTDKWLIETKLVLFIVQQIFKNIIILA